jgi:pimeloyl-ACP methyl ester carboxylesterase
MVMRKTTAFFMLLLGIQSFAYAQNSTCDYVNYNDGNYASVNGIRIYYKSFGEGKQTVLLLHSAYRSMEQFCEQINLLSSRYRVIAMDTRGHGRSTDNDQPYNYSLFASDADALLSQLGINSAMVVGIGDGANTAIQMALTYPKKVEKLVVAGANLTADSKAVSDNILRSVRVASAQSLDSAIIGYYTRFSQNPKAFPAFFEKMKKLLLTYPNLKETDLKAIQVPTLVISGDHDFILLENTIRIFRNIPKSNLFVVPGSGHYAFQGNEMVSEYMKTFLIEDFQTLTKY